MTERNPYHPDGLWPTAGSYTRTDEQPRPEGAERWETWLSRLGYLHDETGASRADLAALANDLATETGRRDEDPSGPLRPLTTHWTEQTSADHFDYLDPKDPR